MASFVICPRCELNIIDEEVQEYCDVCIKEMTGTKTFTDDLDNEEGMEEMELCPICGENYMQAGEKMCDDCKKKSAYEDEPSEDTDDDDAWRTYLDDEEDEIDLGIPDSEFEDDEEEEEYEEYEETKEDDFEYVSADDYYDFDDDDDDDDDEDDDFDDDVAPTPKTGKRKKKKDDF